MKKLYKVEEDRKIFGVCGGVAEYFNIDPTIVRLIWACLSLYYGLGIFLYIVAAFILPDKSDVVDIEVIKKPSRKKKEK